MKNIDAKKSVSASEILKKRAIALSKISSNTDIRKIEAVQLLTFMLGEQRYGVDIKLVREVSTYKEYTPLPKESSTILGLINIRGRIFTIVNIKKLFNLSDNLSKISGNAIILNGDDINLGIGVDAIEGVITCKNENIKPAIETLSTAEKEYICGVTADGIAIISLENMVAERKKIISKE